jgi:hypothetical protein
MMLQRFAITSLVLALCMGCRTQIRNQELEKVAKEWAMVIRASQVIPVYPLTEDLQPGDIFLVQVPIEYQVKEYQRQGFIPLEYLIHRINPSGYKDFYQNSFGAGDAQTPLPRTWLIPGDTKAWSVAPSAGFPTYAFSVRDGGSFNLALPVLAVPVGLSLLDGDAAQGTITIADARTYGVDTVSLYHDVLGWASRSQEFLSNFAAGNEKLSYLRVVTRVYLTGKLNVSLRSSRGAAGSGSSGLPKPVDLLVLRVSQGTPQVTLEAYKSNVEKLNAMIEEALKKVQVNGADHFLPSGTVKVVSASSGFISLSETFSRLQAIGYLGFDMAISSDGMLGPPIPTRAVLEQGLRPLPAAEYAIERLSHPRLRINYRMLVEVSLRDERARSLVRDMDNLEALVPEKYPCNIFGLREGGSKLSIIKELGQPVRSEGKGFAVMTTYQGKLIESIEAIKQTQRNSTRMVEGFEARSPATRAYLTEQLAANEEALKVLNRELNKYVLLLKHANEYTSAIKE